MSDAAVTKSKETFVPDYKTPCGTCGGTPTVTVEENGRRTAHMEMCGPCTFGQADMLDASEWN